MVTRKKKPRKRATPVSLEGRVRMVQTTYYADFDGRVVLKVNASMWALDAATKAGRHLRAQTYTGAVAAEVFDLDSGALYAVVYMTEEGVFTYYKDSADALDARDAKRRAQS